MASSRKGRTRAVNLNSAAVYRALEVTRFLRPAIKPRGFCVIERMQIDVLAGTRPNIVDKLYTPYRCDSSRSTRGFFEQASERARAGGPRCIRRVRSAAGIVNQFRFKRPVITFYPLKRVAGKSVGFDKRYFPIGILYLPFFTDTPAN